MIKRPRVICHMIASIDGRVAVDGWPVTKTVLDHYEQVHASYEPDGWMCGRVTMEPFAGAVRSDAAVARERASTPREDFIAPGEHDSFAFAVDPRGRLAWKKPDIDGDHVVAILTERVPDEYLAFLRQRGVSYLLAGPKDVDLGVALGKVYDRFRVKTLMLEGGGRLNGAMLRAGLVDEVSLLIAPVADTRRGSAALFDVDAHGATPWKLRLESVARRTGDVIWVRYSVRKNRSKD